MFCENCGAPVKGGASFCKNCGSAIGRQGMYGSGNSFQKPPVSERNIGVAVILSLVTCGIYYLYWMAKLNDEMNLLTGETNAPSGGMVVLYSVLSCGLYSLYWMYRMGERCGRFNGEGSESTAVLYLVICLCGFGIVSCAMIQNTVNRVLK